MKKRSELKKHFIKSILSLVLISIIVVAVSSYFIFDSKLIGPVFLIMGFFVLLFMKIRKIKFRFFYPDFVFGFIDNGILVFAAIIGGAYGGVIGAIIGGVTGNTITDGIGGFFEGYIAEKQHEQKLPESKRKMFTSSLGKIAGCLVGAGIGLIVVYFISLF